MTDAPAADRLAAICDEMLKWAKQHSRNDFGAGFHQAVVELRGRMTSVLAASGAPPREPSEEDQERLRMHILTLRSLIARLPLTEYQPSALLQAWFDKMKQVMEATAPTWGTDEAQLAAARVALSLGEAPTPEELGTSGPTLNRPMIRCAACGGVFIGGIHDCAVSPEETTE